MNSHPLPSLALVTVAALGTPFVGAAQTESPTPGVTDVLDLSAGAVVLSWSSQWDEEWAALLLLDDTTERGWSAGEGTTFPHEIVVELAQTTELDSVVFDNGGALEAEYPGISARGVELLASTVGADGPFEPVAEIELEQGARSTFAPAEPVTARWLQLRILSNWGHPEYTELMELEGYGTAGDGGGAGPELEGVYDTNYGLIRFDQTGTRVRGCYDFDGGTLTGSTDGRVVRFEWREDGGEQVGTAVMVLSHSGAHLNGVWYQDGEYQGLWIGSPAEAGVEPDCALPEGGGLERSLDESGRAILYGIRFDVGSAELRPESEATLEEALVTLQERPDLRLAVEGHTDAVGGEAANQALSERRARAVVAWLVEHGIAASRLEARGMGEAEPVASNATAQGRALNRRVELARLR